MPASATAKSASAETPAQLGIDRPRRFELLREDVGGCDVAHTAVDGAVGEVLAGYAQGPAVFAAGDAYAAVEPGVGALRLARVAGQAGDGAGLVFHRQAGEEAQRPAPAEGCVDVERQRGGPFRRE